MLWIPGSFDRRWEEGKGGRGEGDNGEGKALLVFLMAPLPSSAF